MWRLKVAQGSGPYLFSTNNYVGRQIWEFDPEAGTPEERAAVEQARDEYKRVFKKDRSRALPCADLLMRMQLKKENSHIDLSIPSVRVGEKEEVTYDVATTALRKAVRLNCAIQAKDGHWAGENAAPMFFTPPLLIILHISGAINTILTPQHKEELIRYMYLHQKDQSELIDKMLARNSREIKEQLSLDQKIEAAAAVGSIQIEELVLAVAVRLFCNF